MTTDHARTIRVALPMDAALFAEFAGLIADRWPGTTFSGDGDHFVLNLPENIDDGWQPLVSPEQTQRLKTELEDIRGARPRGKDTPGPSIIHEGQLHLLRQDKTKRWKTDRGYHIQWDPEQELWHLWQGEINAPTGFKNWVPESRLPDWLVPNQFPLRLEAQ